MERENYEENAPIHNNYGKDLAKNSIPTPLQIKKFITTKN